jgi:hypothetical protein
VSRAALILLGALALAACGKVGDPEPPHADSFPHQYPKAEILPETGSAPPPPSPRTSNRPAVDPFAPIQQPGASTYQ